METQIVEGFAGASHVRALRLQPQSHVKFRKNCSENEIDERIVKIRPMSTPIDQISRLADARPQLKHDSRLLLGRHTALGMQAV